MDPASRLEAARAAVDAARAVADVHDLDRGVMGEFATIGAGERVPGVRLEDHRRRAEVRVVARYGADLPVLAARVRDAVDAALGDRGAAGWAIDVRIVDVVTEDAGPDEGG